MIRTAVHSEARHIAGLVNKAYRPDSGERGWTHESELVSGARTNAEQVAKLIDANGAILVACDGNAILGCVHIEPAGLACYIGMLATHPSHQNQGLGKQLLAAAEAFAITHYEAACYRMSVLSSRPELLAYYKRRGYQLTGTCSPYPVDAGVGQPRGLELQVLSLVKPVPPAFSEAQGFIFNNLDDSSVYQARVWLPPQA